LGFEERENPVNRPQTGAVLPQATRHSFPADATGKSLSQENHCLSKAVLIDQTICGNWICDAMAHGSLIGARENSQNDTWRSRGPAIIGICCWISAKHPTRCLAQFHCRINRSFDLEGILDAWYVSPRSARLCLEGSSYWLRWADKQENNSSLTP
jgi:hypothetical protein